MRELLVYHIDHKFRLADILANKAWPSRVAYLRYFGKIERIMFISPRETCNIFQDGDRMVSLSYEKQYRSSAVRAKILLFVFQFFVICLKNPKYV